MGEKRPSYVTVPARADAAADLTTVHLSTGTALMCYSDTCQSLYWKKRQKTRPKKSLRLRAAGAAVFWLDPNDVKCFHCAVPWGGFSVSHGLDGEILNTPLKILSVHFASPSSVPHNLTFWKKALKKWFISFPAKLRIKEGREELRIKWKIQMSQCVLFVQVSIAKRQLLFTDTVNCRLMDTN